MPPKPPTLADATEFGRSTVVVRVLVRVADSVTLERLVWLVDTEGTGDNVTVVVPIVMLSCGVRFDNQVVVPLSSPIK